MFLSFVIPIYNDEKYLRECLDSCLAQDLPLSDFEIICVDDGSTDSTPQILREYEASYPNIRLVFQEHRAAPGRSVGLELAQGDYVWFVDHDDIIEKNVLSELKKRTAETNCDRLVFPYYEFYGQFTDEELQLREKGALDLSCIDVYPPDITIWSSIFNREFLMSNNLWPRTRQVPTLGGIYGGDEFFAHECNDYATNIQYWMNRPLYFYRKFLGSGSRKAGADAIKRKRRSYYNRSMASMEKACQWRERYEAERKQYGRATEETTVKMMRWLRESRIVLCGLTASYWREGNKQLKERGFAPFKKPEEYTYTCKAHLKNTAGSGEPALKRAAYYYAYGKPGASLYRLLDLRIRFSRMIQSSETLSQIKRKLLRRSV